MTIRPTIQRARGRNKELLKKLRPGPQPTVASARTTAKKNTTARRPKQWEHKPFTRFQVGPDAGVESNHDLKRARAADKKVRAQGPHGTQKGPVDD